MTMTEAADAKPEPGLWWHVYASGIGKPSVCLCTDDGHPIDPENNPERIGPRLAHLLRAVAGPIGVGWESIETAPKDGKPVWVYVAMAHGLPPFEVKCAWHHDFGWCADELRPVTQWHPEMTKMLRDAERLDWLLKSHGVMAAVSPNAWLLAKTPQEKRTLIDAEMARERKPEGRE